MAGNVVRVTLLSDAQRFKSGFREAEATTESFGKKVSLLGGVIAIALVTKALASVKQFVDESIDAFSKLEQAVGGTEAVFGDASGPIDDFAKGAAEAIGLTEAEFRTATTLIGGQLKRMTGDVDLAAEKSVILTQVAADLAATYGGTTAEAVTALGAAFRGEADPAERFNLNLKIGVQNAKAVEMGLARTTGEVDENARAQALLALIMEQSADAQGQFEREADTVAGTLQRTNATIENHKAVIGETLVPLATFQSSLSLLGTKTLALLNVGFQDLFGNISDVDAAIMEFQIHTGAVVDTAAAAVTVWKEYGVSLFDVLKNITLTREELIKLRDADQDYLLSIGMTEAGIAKLRETTGQYVKDIDRGRGREEEWAAALEGTGEVVEQITPEMAELKKKVEDYWGAQAQAASKTDLATAAIRGNMEAMRELVDPVFNAMNKVKALNEAQAKLAELQADSTTSAEDLAEAEFDVALKLIEAQGAMDGLDPRTLNASIDAIATALDKPRDYVEQLLRDLGLLDGKRVTTYIEINEITRRQTFNLKDVTKGLQHGGPAHKGVPVIVGEAGEEVFVPDEDGTVIPNHKISRGGTPVNGSGSGQPSVTNIYISSLDPRTVVDLLKKWVRDNGGRSPW